MLCLAWLGSLLQGSSFVCGLGLLRVVAWVLQGSYERVQARYSVLKLNCVHS